MLLPLLISPHSLYVSVLKSSSAEFSRMNKSNLMERHKVGSYLTAHKTRVICKLISKMHWEYTVEVATLKLALTFEECKQMFGISWIAQVGSSSALLKQEEGCNQALWRARASVGLTPCSLANIFFRRIWGSSQSFMILPVFNTIYIYTNSHCLIRHQYFWCLLCTTTCQRLSEQLGAWAGRWDWLINTCGLLSNNRHVVIVPRVRS